MTKRFKLASIWLTTLETMAMKHSLDNPRGKWIHAEVITQYWEESTDTYRNVGSKKDCIAHNLSQTATEETSLAEDEAQLVGRIHDEHRQHSRLHPSITENQMRWCTPIIPGQEDEGRSGMNERDDVIGNLEAKLQMTSLLEETWSRAIQVSCPCIP